MPYHKFVVTEADRIMVRNLAAAGVPVKRIARAIGPRATGISERTLFKYFREEMDLAADQVTAAAQSKLIAGINKGDLGAICFWMKCRAGWKERAEHVMMGTGPNGAIDVNIATAGELLRSRIAGAAARIGAGEAPAKPNGHAAV